MIGHYLLTLTSEQEDRVLCAQLHPGPYACGCLVGTANDAWQDRDARGAKGHINFTRWADRHDPRRQAYPQRSGHQYDELCGRFGAERVNAAIRNRILTNRWWRANAAQSPPAFREALESISGEVERVHP